jgi:hypothetical protein
MRRLGTLPFQNKIVTQQVRDSSFMRRVTNHGHWQLPYGITHAARRPQHLHQSYHVTLVPTVLESNL